MNLRFFNSFYSLIALAIPTQTYSSPFNFFQQRPGDKGNGNCHNTGNLYADALDASHASYHAFRSFEHAAKDQGTLIRWGILTGGVTKPSPNLFFNNYGTD